MTLLNIVAICILLSIFLLGVLVVARNPRNKVNISFGVMTLSFLLWLTSNFLVDFSTNNAAALQLTKLTNLFGILSIFTFFVFTAVITEKLNSMLMKVLVSMSIIFAVILSLLTMFTTSIVGGVYLKDGIYGNNVGSAMPFLTAYAIFVLVAAVVTLVISYRESKGFRAQQLKFLILGLSIFSVTALFFNLLIPYFTGNLQTINLTPVSCIFFIGFTSYAIVKHRLMDIRMVVARSVTYVVLLLVLAGFYAAAIFAAQSFIFPEATYTAGYIILQIFLALVMAFSFQPLRRWITKVTDKIFFKNAYDPETFLDTMSHTIGSSIVLIELLYKTLNLITSQMKVSRGQIIVLTDSGKIYTSQTMGYSNAPELKEDELRKLLKDGVVVYDELEETSHLKHLLRKLDASIVVPLKTENDTEGLLILGEKLSGDMYSAGDLRVFEIIAPELAVAVANAKSFEKIEKFNVTLRQEVKKATGELEKKNTQLMELDKAKDEFISMASHQLRTPLTAIKGYLSMLLEGDAGEIKVSQYDFVNEAFNGANRMVGLINDLLNVSRMETGRFFLEPVEIDLEKLVEEEVKQLGQHAKEKHLTLKYVTKGKIPHIWADETKIRQVVMNFIDNAVYYTTAGSVTVKLSHNDKDVIFEVTDTGIGVPRAQQKQLFTKFYRADNARHVRPDGTGLGIYLAKRVLDDHHADLIFISKEGVGSTFGFKFPIKSRLSTKKVKAPGPNGTNCPPAVGELAAGIGVSPQALEATSSAGIEKPLSDSADAGDLTKEATELNEVAIKGGKNTIPDDILQSANEAIKTIQEAEIVKEEERASK